MLNVKERRITQGPNACLFCFAYGLVIIKGVEGAIEGGNVWPGARVSAPAALAFAVVGSCAGGKRLAMAPTRRMALAAVR